MKEAAREPLQSDVDRLADALSSGDQLGEIIPSRQ
jgi:hypothetical protein